MVAKLNPAQQEANRLLGSPATHILLRGGSRSGKTFLLIRALVIRAGKAPGTRHGIFRHRFNALKHSIIGDTFPKVMRLCFPDVPYSLNRTDWFVTLPNGSEILFHGLDSSDRTEKILGLEFATVYLNEASQIGYGARNMLLTRLAQKSSLNVKEYIDANPPTTSHWLYSLFERKVEPKSGEPLPDPADYATMQINPDSNRDNLSPEYLKQLESLPEKERQRFLFGNYQTAIEGALWTLDRIRREAAITDANRAAVLARMRRIVVAVDPSGCSGPEDYRSDEIGISVAGIDADGVGHVLADLSCRAGPAGWAKIALDALDLWRADRIVAEKNFGGAMVESTIRASRATAPVTLVTASRGKFARAEPVAALYEQGKVVHHGRFPDLEDQLCQFSAGGFEGARSPDRADALVWGLTDLMLGPPPAAPARLTPTRFNLGR
ncbi:phage terminase large subunit [Komagataeibacter nataicola]|uniref:phage terminase large subunit n=1 Tax=Komagataeibacter nataicola TaxID=265960 RepID=UPI00197B4A1A|nr:phage terminase large subunit [Komagataeibacter nataicola]WNM08385.1 phage terminase large subunit [Komagataeibacter nataicola]GBR23100.1 phage DNA packaging protein [Komagataeibacter nataicola NRIC 0616]